MIEKINFRKLEILTKINNPLIKRKASFKNHIFKTKKYKNQYLFAFSFCLAILEKRKFILKFNFVIYSCCVAELCKPLVQKNVRRKMS